MKGQVNHNGHDNDRQCSIAGRQPPHATPSKQQPKTRQCGKVKAEGRGQSNRAPVPRPSTETTTTPKVDAK